MLDRLGPNQGQACLPSRATASYIGRKKSLDPYIYIPGLTLPLSNATDSGDGVGWGCVALRLKVQLVKGVSAKKGGRYVHYKNVADANKINDL